MNKISNDTWKSKYRILMLVCGTCRQHWGSVRFFQAGHGVSHKSTCTEQINHCYKSMGESVDGSTECCFLAAWTATGRIALQFSMALPYLQKSWSQKAKLTRPKQTLVALVLEEGGKLGEGLASLIWAWAPIQQWWGEGRSEKLWGLCLPI